MRTRLHALIAASSPQVATDLLEPFVELLQLSRAHCGGDVDKFLVLLVVALRTTRHRHFADRTPQQLMALEPAVLPGLGTNGRSVADSLSMPKETVRRKIRELAETGWIVRLNGQLYLTSAAYRDLSPVREAMHHLAVRCYEILVRLQGEPAQLS